MNINYSSYQIQGLSQLLSFKPSFEKPQENAAYYSNKLLKRIFKGKDPTVRPELVQEFTRIFCDHQLADTDYAAIQKDQVNYNSPELHIADMQLDVLLKFITYIIWTDRFVEGYFYSKIKDLTLFSLLNRLETLLNRSYLLY